MGNHYSIIENGIVVNVVEYSAQPSNPPPGFPSGCIAVQSDVAGPGWTYANGLFTAPAQPVTAQSVPQSITNYQCRAMLIATPNPANSAQTLFDVVNGQITAMPQNSSAYQAWEYANDVTRGGALVAQMAASLGLTSAQVDALFIAASGISA